MDLNHLQYFLEVLECGSLNKAAEKLYISRPALRANLASLEDELGAPLLIYSKHGCTPTALGQSVADDAAMILSHVEKWKRRASEKAAFVSVQSDKLFCDAFLTPLTVQMLKRHFPVRMAYDDVSMKTVLNSIRRGRRCISVVSAFKKDWQNLYTQLPDSSWDMKKLFEDPIYVILNRRHPLAGRDNIEPQELLDYTICRLSVSQHYSEDNDNGFADIFDGRPPHPSTYLVVDSPQNALSIIAAAPKCYAILSGIVSLTEQFRQLSDQICMVPFNTGNPLMNTYNLAFLKEELQSEEERMIIHEITRFLQGSFFKEKTYSFLFR